jgi:hypothetical protein
MEGRFERCYVELLVELWVELKRLADTLAVADAPGIRGRVERGAQILLLELALLETVCERWRGTRLVSGAEGRRLRDLVARLRPLLAPLVEGSDAACGAALVRAQNRLFNEIRALAVPFASHARRAG